MSKPKFKVGDKVRILDGSKIKNYRGGWCEKAMAPAIGHVVTIATVDETCHTAAYYMEEVCCVWDERGLEKVDEKIIIYRDGNKVIAKDLSTENKAVARCCPDDKFDFHTGVKLAFERLMPPEEEKHEEFKVGDFVRVTDTEQMYADYVETVIRLSRSAKDIGRFKYDWWGGSLKELPFKYRIIAREHGYLLLECVTDQSVILVDIKGVEKW